MKSHLKFQESTQRLLLQVMIQLVFLEELFDQLVIEYAYTGEIKLSNETVQSVLFAAQYLGCEHVITACFDFMECNLSTENVLDVLQLAEQIFRPDLGLRARQYIDRYFCDFYRLPVWKKAPAEQGKVKVHN